MNRKEKGFSLIELLIASTIILFVSIALLKGIVDFMRYNLRVQLSQLAIQSVQSWVAYIQSIPYDSWMINPDPNERPGGGDLYCYDCAYNKGFCDKNKRTWPGSSNLYYCSFMDPDYNPYGSGKPFDPDNDQIVSLYDPYYGNNNCKDGSISCDERNKKYFFPTWYMAGWLRFGPDWGQGSSDCACRLGNCPSNYRIGNGWTSYDGSYNYRIGNQFIGGLKCTYELKRGISQSGISWNTSFMKVYIGMIIVNYYYINNPVKEAGKAVGIVAWYFDPVDLNYRSVYQTVFKERP